MGLEGLGVSRVYSGNAEAPAYPPACLSLEFVVAVVFNNTTISVVL